VLWTLASRNGLFTVPTGDNRHDYVQFRYGAASVDSFVAAIFSAHLALATKWQAAGEATLMPALFFCRPGKASFFRRLRCLSDDGGAPLRTAPGAATYVRRSRGDKPQLGGSWKFLLLCKLSKFNCADFVPKWLIMTKWFWRFQTNISPRHLCVAQIPLGSSRHVSTRQETFDVSSPRMLAVSSLLNSTARHARHDYFDWLETSNVSSRVETWRDEPRGIRAYLATSLLKCATGEATLFTSVGMFH